MREIKFRLWDKKDNKMRYEIDSIGFDIDDYLPFRVSIPSGARNSRLVNDTWIEEDGTYKQNENKEAELMQYTGLKDKNGTEIYEGDILKVPVDVNQELHGDFVLKEVLFKNGTYIVSYLMSEKGYKLPKGYTAGYLLECYEYDLSSILFDDNPSMDTEIEVVGNIYITH